MSRDEKLEKKVRALPGGKEFIEEIERQSVADLNSRISRMQKDLEESREHKENNEALKQAKEEVKQLSGAYSDVEKAVKLKTRMAIHLIKEKGGQ